MEGEVFVPAHHFPLPPCSKDEQLCKGVAVLQLNCFEKVKEVRKHLNTILKLLINLVNLHLFVTRLASSFHCFES